MMSHFVPDKHIRVRRRQEEKNHKPLTRNQPNPKIWVVTLFNPRPRDRIAYYVVNPGRPVDLNAVAARLAELFGFDVRVYESLFGAFEVYLGQRAEVRLVEEYTLKALEDDPVD